MKRLLGVACVSLLSANAFAGARGDEPVRIDKTARSASGVMSSARNSVDYYSQITCMVNYGGNLCSGMCLAEDANRQMVSCYFSGDPGMASIAGTIHADSRIYFMYDTTGKCTQLNVTQSSVWAPKNP